MTKSRKTTREQISRRTTTPKKGKSAAQINAWMAENYDKLLAKARRNTIRLTGRPTFGGTTRRKSA